MTGAELRAAAEKVESAWRYSSDWYQAHAAAVATAYLLDHTADDADPVTADWLKSVGFGDNGYDYVGTELRHPCGLSYLTGTMPGWSPWYFCGVMLPGGDSHMSRRGDVRRVLMALSSSQEVPGAGG